MSRMIGADVAQLRQLAAQFDQAAERLRGQAGNVTEGVRVAAWAGPVAVQFRVAWDSTHSVALRAAAETLSDSATTLRKNADAQERASDAHTGQTQSPARFGDGVSRTAHLSIGDLTARDFLGFAKSAGGGDEHLPYGWREISVTELEELGIDPGALATSSGVDATIFIDENGRYVLAFAGSSGDNGGVDWLRENLRSGLSSGVVGSLAGGGPGSFAGQRIFEASMTLDPGTSTEEAMNLSLALKNAVGAENMAVVGHSLGGRHAAAASAVTGATAVTFNAAGLTSEDYVYARTLLGQDVNYGEYILGQATGGLSLGHGLDTSKVTNYSGVGDPLGAVQKATTAYDAVGQQVHVGAVGHGLDSFDGKI